MPVKLYTKQFKFHPDTRSFIAEASELSRAAFVGVGFQEGFIFESSNTGIKVEFALIKTHKDTDGDVTFWEFKPILADLHKAPQLKDVKALIFND